MTLTIKLSIEVDSSDDGDEVASLEKFRRFIDEHGLDDVIPGEVTLDKSLLADLCRKLADIKQIVARARACKFGEGEE